MSEPSRHSIIVDCDPGIDDTLAFLVLLSDETIRIRAIITSMGNTSADNGYDNTLKFFVHLVRHCRAKPECAHRWRHLFKDRIILIKGATEPRGGQKISASYFHGRDGLSDVSTSHPHLTPTLEETEDLYTSGVLARPDAAIKDAPDLILSLLKESPPRTIGLLTMGPFTTLAVTLDRDRKTFLSRCGLIVSMGGALDCPGNTTAVAEFNVRADAYALHECLRGGLGDAVDNNWSPRWVLLPLDITTRHTLPFDMVIERIDRYFSVDRPQNVPQEPLIDFFRPVLRGCQRVMNGFGLDAVELHDPLAAWCMASLLGRKDAKGWKTERRLFDVERTGELTTGMLITDRRSSARLEKGRNRFDEAEHPAPARFPRHGGPPPVQMQPKEVEIVVETPGVHRCREVMIQAFGLLDSSVPVRR